MTVETYPGVLQNRTYTAEILRRMVASLLKRGATVGSVVGGLVHTGDCAISYTGTELKVQVAPGEMWVPGSSNATQSGYYLRVSAAETLTPAAVSGTVRVDAIVAAVRDKAYVGTEDLGVVEVVKGTPKAGATLANLEGAPGQGGGPALPASCLVLGYALIPAAGTAVTVSSTAEVVQPGNQRYEEGLVASRPAFGVKGRIYYATDVGIYYIDTGTAWNTLNLTTSAKSIILGEQERTNVAFGTMPTPDEVSIYVPEGAQLCVAARAQVQSTVSNAGAMALFIGANQLVNNSLTVDEVGTGGTTVAVLASSPSGLSRLSTGYAGDVATGQMQDSGSLDIFGLPAGVYKIGLRFKASSGTVKAKARYLRAWVVA